MDFKTFMYYNENITVSEWDEILKYLKKNFTIKSLPPIEGIGKMANIILQSSNREKDRSTLVKWLDENNFEYIEKPTSDSVVPLQLNYDKQTIRLRFKPLKGRGSKSDPHELMTASLCLLNRKIINIDDPESLLDEMRNVATDVIGYSQSDLDAFDESYDDLAKAVSASNKILDIVGVVDKVFITGKKWASEVEQFKLSSGTIKDYNSSDIIIKNSQKFLGVSLKKKSRVTESDPTLINNAIENLLSDIISQSELKNIQNAKKDFFKKIVEIETKSKYKSYEDVSLIISQWNKTKDGRKKISSYLKTKNNVFYMQITKILEKYKIEFVTKLLNDAFRVNLKNLKKSNFDFALVVGIGKYNTNGFKIDTADYKDIETITSALDKIFSSGKIKVEKTHGKLHGYEKGATAAKIFYTIYVDNEDIINIEIRYKGSYTTKIQPQFLAFVTANFKKIFKDVK